MRVFGRAAALPVQPLARLSLSIALSGFALAAASGSLMFATQPAELLANRAFIVKMGLLVAAGCNALWFHARGSLRKLDRWRGYRCCCPLRSGWPSCSAAAGSRTDMREGAFPMKRRHLVLAAASLPLARRSPGRTTAGAASTRTGRSTWRARWSRARWQNPHAELVIEVPPGLKVPADLAQRALPAQSAPVDGPGLLAKAAVPRRADRQWELELAPLTRMEAWKVAEIKPGARSRRWASPSRTRRAKPVMRVEYLFVDGKVYGLRSSPA